MTDNWPDTDQWEDEEPSVSHSPSLSRSPSPSMPPDLLQEAAWILQALATTIKLYIKPWRFLRKRERQEFYYLRQRARSLLYRIEQEVYISDVSVSPSPSPDQNELLR